MSNESQMGYLEPGYWPLRRRVVEVYGTMPEAQEFVQEEFNLPYLPPAYALQPPMNPKTAPYRRITTLPVSIPITAMGTNGASSGQTFFERYRGWLIAGGVIVGGYFLARAFGLIGGSRNRTIFGNPPVKDYKLQEENAFGWIPSTTGRYPGREQDAARSGWMILRNPYETPITLEQLLRIEREAYPEHMREMQWAEDWEDIADYSEVPLKTPGHPVGRRDLVRHHRKAPPRSSRVRRPGQDSRRSDDRLVLHPEDTEGAGREKNLWRHARRHLVPAVQAAARAVRVARRPHDQG